VAHVAVIAAAEARKTPRRRILETGLIAGSVTYQTGAQLWM
jgi:hypothetical protein